MALYDGFFDAEYNAETDQYDREYESGDFTGYLAQVIGSGVCVYNNEDSFRCYISGPGKVMVMPGYLFIQGHYLANVPGDDEDAETYLGHEMILPGSGTYAIAAHLSPGKRMIELEAVSVSSSYPDSLVLAIVNGTANTADDTRYNTDICGVIDSAGELSKKVEYAINYIDNEIEGKLASVQAEIDAQAAKMDAKIAEAQAIVDRIVPPPVGTIKFTAAQNVGDEWIRCDGSFVNQSDYPDLVEALGRLTPGVESVTELLQANKSEQMSNACLVGGTVWVYMAESKKLVGMTGTTKKEIAVTGVASLEVNPAIDIVLSVVDGAVYLAQNNAGANNFIMLECATFTGSESVIEMTELDVGAKASSGNYSTYIVPSVTKTGGKVNVAAKIYPVYGTSYGDVQCVSWTPGSFENTAAVSSFSYHNNGLYSSTYQYYPLPLLAFSPKNGNDMILTEATANHSVSSPSDLIVGIYSATQGIYGDYSGIQRSSFNAAENIPKTALPVGANYECLLGFSIASRHPVIYYTGYSIPSPIEKRTVDAVSLPSRSKVFKESVVYATAQGLWFVFVGTGLLFVENLAEGSWGFLDTQELIGVIGAYGCLNYDSATNSLYISGMDTAGTPKVARLKLPDLYNYATDGAFLPSLASDGVPAYIKAIGDGGTSGNILKITVLPSTDNFDSYMNILFNGERLVAGTYNRKVDANGTFTIGLQCTSGVGGSYPTYRLKMGEAYILTMAASTGNVGKTQTETFNVSDYIESGITLQGVR